MEYGEQVPVGYQFVKCHMIFDVKAGSLKQKARYVAGGHMTEAPSAITYASVASRESIRIGLLIAALNDLEVFAADIQNSYLTIPCKEKIYTILGEEFGPHRKGKEATAVRALNRRVHSLGTTFQVALDTWALLHPGVIQTSGSDQHRKSMVKNIMNTCLYIQMISWRFVLTQRIY
jgi:hypothetical protein